MKWAEPKLGTLGGRIQYARTCRRYPAGVFCRLLGMPTWRLSDWEAGKRLIPHDQLRELAYYLEVPLKWLVTGDGEPPVRPLTEAQKIMAQVDISPATRLQQMVAVRPKRLPDL